MKFITGLIIGMGLLGIAAFALAEPVTLSWDYTDTNHDGFNMQIKEVSAEVGYQDSGDPISSDARSATRDIVDPGTYQLRLRAFNEFGASAWVESEQFTIVGNLPPVSPTGLTITIIINNP